MSRDIGYEFFEQSKYPRLSPPDQSKDMPLPPIQLDYDHSVTPIALPDAAELHLDPVDLHQLIKNRRTLRKYSERTLTLKELAFLLWCTQGVEEITERPVTYRTVPSAGARHPFETYALVNRVEGLKPGVYRYLALEHQLVGYLFEDDLAEKLTDACRNQNQVKNSAVTFFWCAIPYRTTWRYSERGSRYILLDAGHVCQNLYIAAEALKCGVCAIGAYDDDAVNSILKLDGESQMILYIATVGKK